LSSSQEVTAHLCHPAFWASYVVTVEEGRMEQKEEGRVAMVGEEMEHEVEEKECWVEEYGEEEMHGAIGDR